MKKHVGRILISSELLAIMLQFPGAKLTAARMDEEGGSLELVVEHPDMPEVDEGKVIPVVTPIYRTEYYPDGSIKGLKVDL